MKDHEIVKVSKFLSYVLRHRPDSIGLNVDAHGWANVSELISCAERNGTVLTESIIREVVLKNGKKRFVIDPNCTRIRASNGHSIDVDLQLSVKTPPQTLYHGTSDRFLPSIRAKGLERRNRQYVHLSTDESMALNVGTRHCRNDGSPVVLRIMSQEMHNNGHRFKVSENDVWLIEAVPPQFIEFPDSH